MMSRTVCAAALAAGIGLASSLTACSPAETTGPPAWAYPVNPPAVAGAKQPADDGAPRHIPGSSAAFTLTQLTDRTHAPDWRPDSHPPMPDIVSHGRGPDVLACGFCHLPTGDGRPENASLAGLPYDYIVSQMADMKSGKRRTSVAGRLPTTLMASIAAAATDEDVAAAAKYFSSLTPRSFERVVETGEAPKTYVTGWILAKAEAGGAEPIGKRIIETPESLERFELRDEQVGYDVYAPIGSIRKGEALTFAGDAARKPCTECHGTDLKGVGNVPRLAGRSPSYLVRQLYDFQSGARAGPDSAKMKAVVATLSGEDMVQIAAYLASRAP